MGKYIISQYKFSDGLIDLRVIDAKVKDEKVITIEDGVSFERGLVKDFKSVDNFLVFEVIESDTISTCIYCDNDDLVVDCIDYIEKRVSDFHNRFILRVDCIRKDVHNFLEQFKEDYH